MSYSYATGGSGWRMIPCLLTFLAEVKACVDAGLLDVTNLGQLGDAIHQAEPTSRHNPARAPDGNWYVCAADFGGSDYALLAEFHAQRYREGDARLFRYGFSQRGDGRGLTWFDGSWHWTNSDFGHCHFDVNMAGPSLGSGWYVPALALTTPWGLEAWLRARLDQPATPTPSRNPEDTVFEKLKPGDSICISLKDKTGDITFTTTDGGAQINAGIDGGAALITKDIWLDATNQQEYGVTKVRGAFLTVYHHGIPGDAKTGGTLGIDVRYAPQQ